MIVLIRGRFDSQRGQGNTMTEAEIGVNVLQRWRKGATAKECKQPLEAEKRQGNGFPSELMTL